METMETETDHSQQLFPIPKGYKLTEDTGGWQEGEVVGVCCGAVTVVMAACLIFLPVTGVERSTSFSAGLTMAGAGIGYALRAMQMK